MPERTNRLAVVTGAAGTMGRAITKRLVADGHRVVAIDLKDGPLETLSAGSLGRIFPLALDITEPEAVELAWNGIAAKHGPVQILVNNAGVLSNNKAAQTSVEEWRHIMAVNLDAPFYLSRLGLRDMRAAGWGRIVNICSLSMKTGGLTAGTAYAASKGGLGVLTFSMARESAAQNITVNGIAPGYVLTPMVSEQLTEEQRQAQLRDIPVGRFCDADEVASCVSYLVGPDAGFITGEIIDMNGGMLMD